eukprot:CAMPEP_0181256638 /NCGR_PEP_ID=MMETSP1096-20121128/49819_1 /TAXON_ID=156174 ORGANISM="Chrysochromulina ericina, Strain CCMP281" /NCGR_SAMPLE_ID=MMETSP1096 /ASSEMBLY_ACC=CAM_ASM_000453 /LENGTH=62 /DNA_ID=CAMNT_0023354905 /DNA_START=505 /DNA_END=689 /DNA_ORIENTATION=+
MERRMKPHRMVQGGDGPKPGGRELDAVWPQRGQQQRLVAEVSGAALVQPDGMQQLMQQQFNT